LCGDSAAHNLVVSEVPSRRGGGHADRTGETIEDEGGLPAAEAQAHDALYVWPMKRRKDDLSVDAMQKVRRSCETRHEHITVVGVADSHITFAIQGAAGCEHHASLFE
jgi:hypothetical protein